MNMVADILALVCLTIGLFFIFVGSVGVLRLPDVYHRLHGATKATTLGLVGMLLAVVFHLGEMAVLIKAGLTLLFAFVAVPVGSHMLSRAAMYDRAHQWEGTLSDDHAKDRLEPIAGPDSAPHGEQPPHEPAPDDDSFSYAHTPDQATP